MRYRSAKKEAEYKKRRPLVQKILSERPMCEACKILAVYESKVTYVHKPSVDAHEIMPRSAGGSILDENNILALCRDCHNWVTTHPLEAQNMGLSLPSWATPEMYGEAAALREAWSEGRQLDASWVGD